MAPASLYPDGSENENWTRFRVILPKRDASSSSSYKVQRRDVAQVKCHRASEEGHEQYLVRWRPAVSKIHNRASSNASYSWHDLDELANCLELVQQYLESLVPQRSKHFTTPSTRKRRNDEEGDCSSSESQSRASTPLKAVYGSAFSLLNLDAINGYVRRENGIVTMQHAAITVDVAIPTDEMLTQAAQCDTRQASQAIRVAFDRKISTFQPPASLEIINQEDRSRPPLDFEFIDGYKYGPGVAEPDPGSIEGCGNKAASIGRSGSTRKCQSNMGQNCGCEYSRVCECLEYAAVDMGDLSAEEKEKAKSGYTDGLPKHFPYYQKTGLLRKFYLESRHAIYECNMLCHCGPDCKTRVVQKGRTIPLQIFKTRDRGWGLRSTTKIQKGQFIDTYRGEIITDDEAERREKNAVSGLKSSYLYSLDKHTKDDEPSEDKGYVVDGEYMGGPTRFLNHSCDPNVRQHTVSYNKNDSRIYDIAFFACVDIEAMEELTFDYQDKEDEEEEGEEEQAESNGLPESSQNAGATKLKCRCGSENCRGTLWM